MPRRALVDHRPWLLLSLIAGVSYFFVQDDPIGGIWLMAWKGAGVGFLAVYAAFRGKGADGMLIALVMALGALADIVLEISFLIGGAIFALGHLVAIALYLRNHRREASDRFCPAAAPAPQEIFLRTAMQDVVDIDDRAVGIGETGGQAAIKPLEIPLHGLMIKILE